MKPVPAPTMLMLRHLLLSVALLLSTGLFPGEAGAEWGLEITPYAGYTIGGTFQDNSTGADLDVKEGGSFGLVLGLPDTPETQYELFYGFQRTQVAGGGTFGGNTLFDLDIHYLHVGGTYIFPGEKVRPFISGRARRDPLRAGRERDGPENVLLRLAGRGSQDTDLRSRRPSLRGEGVPDDPSGQHGDLLRVVRRRRLHRKSPGGRARSASADGGDHLFVVRKAWTAYGRYAGRKEEEGVR